MIPPPHLINCDDVFPPTKASRASLSPMPLRKTDVLIIRWEVGTTGFTPQIGGIDWRNKGNVSSFSPILLRFLQLFDSVTWGHVDGRRGEFLGGEGGGKRREEITANCKELKWITERSSGGQKIRKFYACSLLTISPPG